VTGSLRTGGVLGRAHRAIAGAVLVVLAVTGCAAAAGSGADRTVDDATTPAAANSPPSTTTAPAVIARAAVTAAQDAASSSTELGVAVLDRTTGEIAVGARGDEPFYTASVAKVIVAVDILDRRRSTGLSVSDEALDLIRRALGPSDDDAMNVLWTTFDGPGAATRVSARLGLDDTSAPEDPTQWGQMSTSASDMVHVYHHILEEMPAADRDLLVAFLADAPAVAPDGFDQAFGLLAPEVMAAGGPDTIAKQGWMCCFSRQYYLHSAGAVGAGQRYVVVLLSRVPRGPGWAAAREELTAVADAAVAVLTRS
jgi:hypothetical protein